MRAAVTGQALQRAHQRADMMPVHRFHLADLGRIDVDVCDELRARCELVRYAGHAVVEARAQRQHEVAILHRVVCIRGAVHAEHVQGQWIGGVEPAQAHQGGGHRQPEGVDECTQCGCRTGCDHATAGVDQRTFCLHQCSKEGGTVGIAQYRLFHCAQTRAVASQRQLAGAMKLQRGVLHVLRHVHHHRAGTTAAGEGERGAQGRFQLRWIGDQEHMLGAGTHDVADRRFLERVAADCHRAHLTADHDQRDRVGHRVAHRRDHVGGAGAGGDHRHADLAGGTRVARGHEARALFVGRHDQRHRLVAVVLQVCRVVAEHGVVHRQDGAAGIAEHHFDAFIGEYLHDHVGTTHRVAGKRMVVGGDRRCGVGCQQLRRHNGSLDAPEVPAA